MMMIDPVMKTRLVLFILLLASFCLLRKAEGQQSDFQCWPSIQMNLELVKNLKFQVEEEIRFSENATQIDRQINDIGLSYRINKFLKAGFFYRLEANRTDPGEFEWRNGIYADLSFRYEPGRFILGYRLRMQSSKVELMNNEDPWFRAMRNRHKFSVDYDIKGIPLTPYIDVEIFAHMGGKDGYYLTAYRIWAGLKYSLNNMHEFTIKYGIERELNASDPLRAYIVALGYAIDLKMLSGK